MAEEKICILCGKEIEKKYTPDGKMYCDDGNNALPLKEGRCCDKCNMTKVVPERLKRLQEREAQK